MIQICGKSIALPLTLVFETSLTEKKFPVIWKLANIVPVHKKEENKLLKNYRPTSHMEISKCSSCSQKRRKKNY